MIYFIGEKIENQFIYSVKGLKINCNGNNFLTNKKTECCKANVKNLNKEYRAMLFFYPFCPFILIRIFNIEAQFICGA
jgi:hypothetical protein